MFDGAIDYTICSTDPEHYNRISCNLITPSTYYTSIIVTSLTCNCDMLVLNQDDFVKVEFFPDKREPFIHEFRNAIPCKAFDRSSAISFVKKCLFEIIPDNIEEEELVYLDMFQEDANFDSFTGLFRLSTKIRFRILDMSYNIKLITGFYNMKFPVESEYDSALEEYFVKAKSIGFTLSTPILYLTSNVGVQSYRTNLDTLLDNQAYGLQGSKVVMRINNTFITDAPIIVNNADFQTIVPSNDLSMIEFKLVDANMREIHLLSPMYITIHAEAIKDEVLTNYIMFEDEVQRELQKIEEATSYQAQLQKQPTKE